MLNSYTKKMNTTSNVAKSFASAFSCAKKNMINLSDTVIITVSVFLCLALIVISNFVISGIIILLDLIIIINTVLKKRNCKFVNFVM